MLCGCGKGFLEAVSRDEVNVASAWLPVPGLTSKESNWIKEHLPELIFAILVCLCILYCICHRRKSPPRRRRAASIEDLEAGLRELERQERNESPLPALEKARRFADFKRFKQLMKRPSNREAFRNDLVHL